MELTEVKHPAKIKLVNRTGLGRDTIIYLVDLDGQEVDISSLIIGDIVWRAELGGMAMVTLNIRLAQADIKGVLIEE